MYRYTGHHVWPDPVRHPHLELVTAQGGALPDDEEACPSVQNEETTRQTKGREEDEICLISWRQLPKLWQTVRYNILQLKKKNRFSPVILISLDKSSDMASKY